MSSLLIQSGNSILGGTGTVRVSGKYTWMQGTQQGSGETVADGGMDIISNRHDLKERTLTINDSSTWTGRIIYLFEGATIDINRAGGYEPPVATMFEIMAFSSRMGTFTTINDQSIENGTEFQVNYAATDVTLEVVNE